jgi:hypothetical protein
VVQRVLACEVGKLIQEQGQASYLGGKDSDSQMISTKRDVVHRVGL